MVYSFTFRRFHRVGAWFQDFLMCTLVEGFSITENLYSSSVVYRLRASFNCESRN